MWIAQISIASNNEVEKINVTAPTLNSLYVKLYKHLRLGILEILIHQNEGK